MQVNAFVTFNELLQMAGECTTVNSKINFTDLKSVLSVS